MSIEGEDFFLFGDIAFSERTDLSVHRVLDRWSGRAEQVAAGGGADWLKEVREFAREGIFERGEPVEDADAFVWLESHRLSVEHRAELVEQVFVLRLKIALIEIVADDESLKLHFGEVCRERVLAVDFGDADGNRRQRSEPVEMRQQLGERQRRDLKKEFASFEEIRAAVLFADDLCAAPLEKA